MKSYILLKDLPNIKAGVKFIQHPNHVNRYYPETEYENGQLIRESSALSGLCAVDVENNPEWFKYNVESYTEKLILRYREYAWKNGLSINDCLGWIAKEIANKETLPPIFRVNYLKYSESSGNRTGKLFTEDDMMHCFFNSRRMAAINTFEYPTFEEYLKWRNNT